MKFTFPNLAILKAAIASGALPQDYVTAEVGYRRDEDRVVVWCDKRLPRGVRGSLDGLQVDVASESKAKAERSVVAESWLHVFPLEQDEDWREGADLGEVLIEFTDESLFPVVIREMINLGNDRLSYHRVADGEVTRTLVKVIDPPYYSLLGALDDDLGLGMTAYRRYADNVWIQMGLRHPFADQFQVAPDTLLLVGANNSWRMVESAAFTDIFSVIDFGVPGTVTWESCELEQRITIPLRLSFDATAPAPTLWVLKQDAIQQVEDLVAGSDNRLLGKLLFAVGELGGQTVVVLRLRPGLAERPVLILDGHGFAPYLKLDNLFVPIGASVKPPLRRSLVSQLIAPQAHLISWLYPLDGDDFITESLSDEAFRPLTDWVDYILEQDGQSLQAWVAAHQFAFESYEVVEGFDESEPKRKKGKRKGAKKKPDQTEVEDETEAEIVPAAAKKKKKKARSSASVPQPVAARDTDRQALREAVHELESSFRELKSPLNDSERCPLWRDLAEHYTQLSDGQDATVCWSNLVWIEQELSDSALDVARAWRASEAALMRQRPDGVGEDHSVSAGYLAATLVVASQDDSVTITAPVARLAQQLERDEAGLPVKGSWLAWVSLATLAGHDALMLARARDRALRRLYEHGLRPESNFAGFMMSAGQADAEKLRFLRSRLDELRNEVTNWIEESASRTGEMPRTTLYADLAFAFAWGRLGEAQRARQAVAAVESELPLEDESHVWLMEAFSTRVEQVLRRDEAGARREDENRRLADRLETLDRTSRYVVDRLRAQSVILQSGSVIRSFQSYLSQSKGYDDAMGKRIIELYAVRDPDELKQGLVELMNAAQAADDTSGTTETTAIAAALDLCPNTEGQFALDVFERARRLLADPIDLVDRSQILEGGIRVAGHFGNIDAVTEFCAHYEAALPQLIQEYVAGRFEKGLLDRNEDSMLFVDLFPVLRKHRLDDEMRRMFSIASQQLERLDGWLDRAHNESRARAVRLGLYVAGGWLHLHEPEAARPILARAREFLFTVPLGVVKRVALAVQYVKVLGVCRPSESLPLMLELFARDENGRRKFDVVDSSSAMTASHFGLYQLRLVEAVLISAVGEEFSLNDDAQNWLDEDEFVIRQRIHRDVLQWE